MCLTFTPLALLRVLVAAIHRSPVLLVPHQVVLVLGMGRVLHLQLLGLGAGPGAGPRHREGLVLDLWRNLLDIVIHIRGDHGGGGGNRDRGGQFEWRRFRQRRRTVFDCLLLGGGGAFPPVIRTVLGETFDF